MFSLGEFRFIVATTPTLLEAVYRLRYQVYVEEYGFEKPEDHPEGLEKDEYDPYAVHIAAIDGKNNVVGTFRVIINSGKELPALRLAAPHYQDKNPASRKIVEVSRLALSHTLHGRVGSELLDFEFFLKKMTGKKASASGGDPMREKRVVVVLGLIRLAHQVVWSLGARDIFIVAERRLSVLLKRFHIHLRAIGPEVDYHGRRTPFLTTTQDVADAIARFRQRLDKSLGIKEILPPISQHILADVPHFDFGGFRFTVANDMALLEEIYRLRKQNMVENLNLDENNLPAHLLNDIHDAASIHIAALGDDGHVAGAVRLTLDSPAGMPYQEHAPIDPEELRGISRKKIVSVTRLSLASPYREAVLDMLFALVSRPAKGAVPIHGSLRHKAEGIFLGLFRIVYLISKQLRISHWCLLADDRLARIFSRHGLTMHRVSPVVDGRMAVYMMKAHEVEVHMNDFRSLRALAQDLSGRGRDKPATGIKVLE